MTVSVGTSAFDDLWVLALSTLNSYKKLKQTGHLSKVIT